ncbi:MULTISPECIES: PadR family transcriptional regulator [Pseudonocardia]|uniref:PadR family transcriptional regulator n=1 Tax=Pseudonocardia TaxID=1847 RepID=UPI000F77B6A0|nr:MULTISPECIES: hypothetical protein [Pseudonocardia]
MPASMLDNPAITSLLGLLVERPLHLYALSKELPRRLDASGLPTGRGSLRNLLVRLHDIGWIELVRPDATDDVATYRTTREGVDELRKRVRSQVEDTSPDHDHFIQAIAYIGLFEAQEACLLLGRRRERLATHLADVTREHARALDGGQPWTHLAEVDYTLSQTAAAIAWLDRTIDRLRS